MTTFDTIQKQQAALIDALGQLSVAQEQLRTLRLAAQSFYITSPDAARAMRTGQVLKQAIQDTSEQRSE